MVYGIAFCGVPHIRFTCSARGSSAFHDFCTLQDIPGISVCLRRLLHACFAYCLLFVFDLRRSVTPKYCIIGVGDKTYSTYNSIRIHGSISMLYISYPESQ
jgi:hypothetical protein